jgi:hypothetical protein
MKIKFTLPILFLVGTLAGFSQTIIISPNNANKGQSLPVSITGIGTNFTKGSNTVTFIRQGTSTAQITISGLTVVNNSLMGGLLNTTSAAVAGTYTVRVTNNVNGIINLVNGFTVNTTSATPSLIAIAPNTAMQGQSLGVSITGLNTNFSSGSNTVKFFKQGTESFDFEELYNAPLGSNLLNSQIFVSPFAPLGVYTVGVQNNKDGLVILNNSFTITQTNKSLVTLLPNKGLQKQTLNVTITGLNTNFNTGSSSFIFLRQESPTSDIEIMNVSASSATSANIQIQINQNADTGLYDIVYFNELEGAVLKTNAFNVYEYVTGTPELNKAIAQIFPNPASQIVNITSNQIIKEIQLIDITGRLITNKIPANYQNNFELDLGDLQVPKGIYVIKITTQAGIITKKIIID